MEIDIKKNENKEFDFISAEGSNAFDVNRLQGVKNIKTTYLLNKANNILSKKTEVEFKEYFSKSREELKNILKEILEIGKNDFKEENENLIKSLIPSELNRILNKNELDNKCMITYEGNVTSLPETPKSGGIYGLIKEDNEVVYYLFLNNDYVILLDKEYYNKNYYRKNEINLKYIELSSQIDEILLNLESLINNTISKQELNELNLKISLIQHNINELKAFLNI